MYDAKNQLIAVIDPASDTARYSYDPVGNLLAVARYPSTTVSILEFRPKRGPVGTTVTIQGTGFGATPGLNTVTVNGTAATVTAASPYELTVAVPAGATTGPVAVTAPGGSATTAPTPFEVTATDGAPTITGFTPNVGTAATPFTIAGTEFDPVPTNDKVLFLTTGTPAPVGTATTTSLGVTVPATATSGRVSVATPGGTAQSAMDFFIPPYPYPASSVVFTGRLTVGGANLTGTIGTASKIGLVVFDGAAGQRLNLGVTALTITQADMMVYKPDGTLLTQALIAGWTTLDTPPLPVTGTYQLAIVPRSTFTGSFTLTLSEELVGTLTVGGPSVPVTVTRPGQRARLTFESPAGRRLSLGMTAVTLGNTYVSLLNPDGSTLVWGSGSPNTALDAPPTVAAGTHAVLIDQNVATTGSLTLTLSEEVTGTITTGGSSLLVSVSRPGQRARLAFDGVAGQRLSLGTTGTTFPPNPNATVFKPDGTTQAGPLGFPGGGSVLDFGPLATTGSYSILIDSYGVDTGTVTLWLSEEVTGTITPGGASLPLTIERPGQRARIAFSGTAGQRVSLKLTGVTVPSWMFASLINPDGTTLGPGQWLLGATSLLDTKTLASPGTHAFLLDPNAVQTGDLTLTAYDVPADVTGTLTINGATLPVSLAVPGQNAVLSVTAPAGTPLTARVTNGTMGCFSLFLKESSGTSYNVVSPCGASGTVTRTMTTTGTHTIIVDPTGANTGTADVSVTNP
ncbi:MAG: IPT/TIG domain-containing protein [Candidatus Rokuibacteriota bacterium]